MATDRLTDIFTSMRHRLKTMALHFTNSSHDADDALQEAFCSLWNNRKKIDMEAAPCAYVTRSVINAAIDIARTKKISLATQPKDTEEWMATDTTDEGTVTAEEILDRLTLIIDSELPPMQRQIMRLHDLEGLDNEEIARLLSLSQGNVRANLARARARVRDAYHNIYSRF